MYPEKSPYIHYETNLCKGLVSRISDVGPEEIHAWRMTYSWGKCWDPSKGWLRFFGGGPRKFRRHLPVLQNDPPPFQPAILPQKADNDAAEPEAQPDGLDACSWASWGECRLEQNTICQPLSVEGFKARRAHLHHALASVSVGADELFFQSKNPTDLAVARVLRAVLLASVKGETKRLQKMAESARLLLDESKYFEEVAEHTGFESLDDHEWDRCAQPFRAHFWIHARDLRLTDRTEVARRLLEAAVEWPRFWEERGHELLPGHETPDQLAARKTAERIGQAINEPVFREIDPKLGIPRASSNTWKKLQDELEEHFRSTPPDQWSSEENGRAVVRLFLGALGVPLATRKNFFSFLDKATDKPPEQPEREDSEEDGNV